VSATIEQACGLIEARLREIGEEQARLNGILKHLRRGAGGAASNGSRRVSGPRRSARKRERAPRGLRRKQFLAALKENPGAKASEIAVRIGVSVDQGYALARQLRKSGEIRKAGRGLRTTAKADASGS
jgi:hypothetical protein